ncbi:hypothetical protein BH10PSE15_BH10PSE15_07640 [soil metagenome]
MRRIAPMFFRFADFRLRLRPDRGAQPVAAIGVWECDLATERLRWSDGVYDLFGLPRGSVLDRATAVRLYDRQSRIEMECLRTTAIRDRTGFSIDALIHPARGVERWIRITAQVECVAGQAVRLFGAKHDVTQEHLLWAARGLHPTFAHH